MFSGLFRAASRRCELSHLRVVGLPHRGQQEADHWSGEWCCVPRYRPRLWWAPRGGPSHWPASHFVSARADWTLCGIGVDRATPTTGTDPIPAADASTPVLSATILTICLYSSRTDLGNHFYPTAPSFTTSKPIASVDATVWQNVTEAPLFIGRYRPSRPATSIHG